MRRPFARVMAGIVAVLAAFVVREAVSAVAGPDFSQYVIFYPAIMVVALFAGLAPALFAVALTAAVMVALRFLPDHVLPFSSQVVNFVSLLFFVAVCVFLAVVAELYRRSRRKAAAWDKEQALRESQEALRRQAELLRLSFDAIMVWTIEGRIESWNRGAEELYGWREQEAVGREIGGLLRSGPGTTWQDLLRILQSRGQWHGELHHVTRDGREVVVSSRLHLGHAGDRAPRVLQIDRDISEEKRVQEELRRAHDELEEKVLRRTADLQKANRTLMMVSACDQALVQVGEEGELIGVICQLLQDEGGYPLVWVGRVQDDGRLRCAASAGDHDGYLDSLRAAGGNDPLAEGPAGESMRRAQPVVAEEITGGTGAPGDAWRAASLARGFRGIAAFPLLRAPGTALGVLVILASDPAALERSQVALLQELVNDLAFGIVSLRARRERDEAQRGLAAQAAQLRQLAGEVVRTEQRERRRIAQVLHDHLQQLLAAALYGLAGLRDEARALARQEAVARIDGLLRDCIAMSRSLTSELGHPALSEPDVSEGLAWLAGWMKENHGLDVEVRGATPVVIEAEEVRVTLLQGVKELLFNVVKHAGVREATVEVHTDDPRRIAVTVADAGRGFDPGLAAAGSIGSGVGLFSIRERLALTGGGMELDCAPGKGSRVTVWVAAPAAAPAVAAAPAPPAAAVPPRARSAREKPSGRIRLLLVDDHAMVREGLALRLRQVPDIEVVGEAPDGARALELVEELEPDVLTMDVSMPGMSGVEATRRIRSARPEVAVIGLSMFDDAGQAAAMREAGAAVHLSKSTSVESLVAAIRAAAAGARP